MVLGSDAVYTEDAIPQQSIRDNPKEEYLKAIDELFGFEPEGNLEHASYTGSMNVHSKPSDRFLVEYIH